MFKATKKKTLCIIFSNEIDVVLMVCNHDDLVVEKRRVVSITSVLSIQS